MDEHPPIVMMSCVAPRLCAAAAACTGIRPHIAREVAPAEVLVIAPLDGQGEGVVPIMDFRRPDWWHPVAYRIKSLQPSVLHIQYECGLYEHRGEDGLSDHGAGLLELLEAVAGTAIVLEIHQMPDRLGAYEANFFYNLWERAHAVILKSEAQDWRFTYHFQRYGWKTRAATTIPYGIPPDRRVAMHEIPRLREALVLPAHPEISTHLVGLAGWARDKSRWDALFRIWEHTQREITRRTGLRWDLLVEAAPTDGAPPADAPRVRRVSEDGMQYYEFARNCTPDPLCLCDFVVVPGLDNADHDALSRVIALSKPFLTTGLPQGLLPHALASGGALLFSSTELLGRRIIDLACDEGLRLALGGALGSYIDTVAAWPLLAHEYLKVYEHAQLVRADTAVPQLVTA